MSKPYGKQPRSGKCPECGYRVRLLHNGKIGTHRLYGAAEWRYCPGWFQWPVKEEQPKEKRA